MNLAVHVTHPRQGKNLPRDLLPQSWGFNGLTVPEALRRVADALEIPAVLNECGEETAPARGRLDNVTVWVERTDTQAAPADMSWNRYSRDSNARVDPWTSQAMRQPQPRHVPVPMSERGKMTGFSCVWPSYGRHMTDAEAAQLGHEVLEGLRVLQRAGCPVDVGCRFMLSAPEGGLSPAGHTPVPVP